MSGTFLTLNQFKQGVAMIRDELGWNSTMRRFDVLYQPVQRDLYIEHVRYLRSKLRP